MNLRKKILLGFGVILALVGVIWAWGIIHISQLGNASDAILRENYRSILAAENMLASLERQDSAILLVASGDRSEGLAQFRAYEVEFLQWLSRAQDNVTIEGEAEILQTLQEEYAHYISLFDDVISSASVEEAPPPAYATNLLPQFEKVRNTIGTLRSLNQATMVEASQRAQRLAQRAVWSMGTVGIVVSLSGLVLSLWFSRFLTRPLRAMAMAADQIAEGDYAVNLDTGSGDELAHLAQAMMSMSAKLNAFHRMNVGHLLAEKRRSEAIIQSITDGLVVVDANLMIIAINPKAEEIFATTAGSAIGCHIFDIIQDQMLYEAIRAAAHGETPPAATVDPESYFQVQHQDGSHTYRFTVTAAKSDQQTPFGIVLLLQDVTKLKELDRLKSDFVMTASHELRTPLTGMAMSLGLLAETTLPRLNERERELMTAAQDEVQRLRALVNDLLDLSKIEAGRMEMHFEAVAPAWLVDRAVHLFSDQAAAKNIELAPVVEPDLSPVRADPTKITWVLTNLIGNALRYTPPSGRIAVTAGPGHEAVYFSVEDNGAGIPPEYQSRIFDKFVQVGANHPAEGTGLGLAICKEIVKAHQGAIWLDSQAGQGSKFTFTLPVIAGALVLASTQEKDTNHGDETTAYSDRGR